MTRFRPIQCVVIVCLLFGGACSVFAQADAPITAAKVVVRKMALSRTFVGSVLPMRTSTIGSAVDGRVVEFPLRPGDRVEEDGTVAKLLTDTLSLQIKAGEAELQLRKAELSEMERSEDVDVAAAKVASSKARHKYAEARRTRYEDLYKQGRTVTQEEYELALTESLEAAENVRVAEAEYRRITEGGHTDQIAQARARVLFADAAIDLLKSRLAKHRLRCPFAGYVSKTYTEVGAWLASGAPAVEIVELDRVEIEVNIPEQFITAVAPGMPAQVTFDGLPDQLFELQVTSIVPQGDVRTRTFPVRLQMNNRNSEGKLILRAGMFCKVSLAVEAEKMAMLIPKDALVLGGRSPLVYVISKDPRTQSTVANPVPVVIGPGSGNDVQVVGGFEPGDLVVVGGNERLRPGQAVRVAKVVN